MQQRGEWTAGFRALKAAWSAAFVAVAAVGGLMAAPTTALACELTRPVTFAGLDYDSAAFHTTIARTIVEKGFGCRTERIPGATIPLVNGLARGDVDVTMEIWLANPVQPWVDAERDRRVVRLGTTFPDATEGWFVPRALVEGAGARAPGLRSVSDLIAHKALFADPDAPDKGLFYNCVPGWQCELVNSRKLIAYGLEPHFTNVRPGASEALVAAIESALRRGRPVVFYHWSPSWLVGAYDLVRLTEPAFDRDTWAAMLAAARPDKATAYPVSEVVIGANTRFVEAAPQISAFLRAYRSSSQETSTALAAGRAAGITVEQAALRFMKEQPQVWRAWVPADVATRVAAAL
ncbi:MAG: ABC transporter substrate-binding protein [Alphaproteobacteria bacterium]|nr:MAG: ABC transporter substrate-binding protein [Alphaproteobacteria bacterium]